MEPERLVYRSTIHRRIIEYAFAKVKLNCSGRGKDKVSMSALCQDRKWLHQSILING